MHVPKKSFGQNFLQDTALLKRTGGYVAALGSTGHLVYEIGAGLGALTEALLQAGLTVHAIERDRDLIPVLRQKFSTALASGSLVLHEADAVRFLESAVIPGLDPGSRLDPGSGAGVTICGNLPYHLSSSIFFALAELHDQISGGVFLIQKEVADRIAAKPNSKTYGLLSVLLQAYFHVQILEHVPPSSFWPPPKVDSSLIRLKPHGRKLGVPWKPFVEIVKAAFSKRRKVLTNSLADYPEIESILISLNIDPKSRAENLSFEDYERIVAATIKK